MKRLIAALLIAIAFLSGILITRIGIIPPAPTAVSNGPIKAALAPSQTGTRSVTSTAAAVKSGTAPTGTPTGAAAVSSGTAASGAATGNAAADGSTATRTLTRAPTETIPPYTPLATLTPSRTLRPPPTFEPPTATLPPTVPPTLTPTPTVFTDVQVPGLKGNETATPTSTAGCVPRKDWKLTYTVQRDDALSTIADRYNTNIDDLMKANCLTNKNLIVIGQVLKVPGTVQPIQPAVVCVPFELVTPMNGTLAIAGGGNLTFNWRGPRAPRNLIRIFMPNGGKFEDVIELRQNDTIDIGKNLPEAGTYTWYVFPLDSNFVQVCPEGGPWTFTKAQAPTATATTTVKLGP